MLVVKLEGDDIDKCEGFIRIGRVAHAIARAKRANNLLDAERKIFPRINAGVQSGALSPLDSETMVPLSRSDYGLGIVPFAELAEWGRATKLFEFKIVPAAASGKIATSLTPVNDDGTQRKPWLIKDSRDPEPDGFQPWYTPARYFARNLIADDSTLLVKRDGLAKKVSTSLAEVGVFKRGKKKEALDPSTVKKAFVNVILS